MSPFRPPSGTRPDRGDDELIAHRFEHGMFVRETTGGDPAWPPILYVHGLGESGLCFEDLLRHPVLAGRRQIAADIPGYGRSPWTERPLRLAEQADGLAAWLRKRGTHPVVLVGHSMGGVSGLLLCERHPELVTRFLNVEGNITIEDCTYSGQADAWTLEGFLEKGFERLLDAVYRAGLEDEPLRRYYASLRHCDPRLYHLNGRELVETATAETPAARLAALPMPVTYVAGVPRGAGARSRRRVEEAGIASIVIEDAGHWPFLDHPDRFASELRRLLEAG
jgi:pimeloyl-ACP methyl ester carboxylesterase